MGLINCKKHGYQSVIEGISEDMLYKINHGISMKTEDIVLIKSKFWANQFPYNEFMISKKLFDSLDLVKTTLETQDEADLFYTLIRQYIDVICNSCLKIFIHENCIDITIYNQVPLK